MSITISFLKEIIYLWLEISPYLLLGMAISGLLHVFLGKELISRQLGRGGIGSVVKATLLGIPLPVCSCGVIPIVRSLQKEGAHKSSVLAFLVATPTTGVDSIFATYSLLGPLFAIFRPLAALICGITLGVLDYFIEGNKAEEKIMKKHEHVKLHPVFHWNEFIRYSFVEILQDIGKPLITGILLGAAIAVFFPAELFTRHTSMYLDFLAALLLGIPLYVCATGSIPVAVSLIAKGFSPGAGLIFLIAGPATNAITLAFVYSKLGKKSFYLYLINIIVVSVVMGLIFNYIWNIFGANIELISGAGKMLSFEFKLISGVILAMLTVNALLRRKSCEIEINDAYEVSVPNIDCGHCKITLEAKLKEMPGVEKVFVDVEKKRVLISGNADKQLIREKIKEAGYTPE
ncbi:MAG: permease [Candidatus Omnitrophica bacterium]|nr:permease [Candidatus Omnitrophota bacterium]